MVSSSRASSTCAGWPPSRDPVTPRGGHVEGRLLHEVGGADLGPQFGGQFAVRQFQQVAARRLEDAAERVGRSAPRGGEQVADVVAGVHDLANRRRISRSGGGMP
jgi:hypothetical protein